MNNQKIFVGICAYNEEKNIGGLLENLLNEQNLSENSEILVVCSGCEDRTPEIVKSFCEKDKRVNLILEDDRRGKASALNLLFQHVRGKKGILVLLNADTLPSSGSINKLVNSFKDKNVGATMGRPVPVNEKHGISNGIVHAIWDLHHEVSLRKGVKLSAELCALRTSIIEKIPTDLATDEPYIEMLIRQRGYEIFYVPDAVVNIRGPDNLKELFKQRRRIATGHIQVEKVTGFKASTFHIRNVISSFFEASINLGSKLRKLPYLLVGVIVEALAHLAARWDFKKGRIPYAWEPIKSTKKLH